MAKRLSSYALQHYYNHETSLLLAEQKMKEYANDKRIYSLWEDSYTKELNYLKDCNNAYWELLAFEKNIDFSNCEAIKNSLII